MSGCKAFFVLGDTSYRCRNIYNDKHIHHARSVNSDGKMFSIRWRSSGKFVS